MRILIKYPTKFRTHACLEQIHRYIHYADNFSANIQMIISVDEDDNDTIEKIAAIHAMHKNINVVVGKPNGKIAAINRDMPDPLEFDILVLASDDMIPVIKGYDTRIIERMNLYFPDTDGVLFFNDGFRKDKLNTLVICGSKYYQRFGYIYHPDYKSFYCDNEFTDIANNLNKQVYINEIIIKHEHPDNNNTLTYDLLYNMNHRYYPHDRSVYIERKRRNFPLASILPLASITNVK